MARDRFDWLTRLLGNAATRRSAVRTLLGPGAGALALIAATPAASLAGDAKKRRRKRKRKKRQCNTARGCKPPRNPCQQAVCERRRCVQENLPDGAICGDGRECLNGECICPNGVCVLTVSPSNLNGWDIALDSEVEFVTGPAAPPRGTGSVRISTIEETRSALANQDYAEMSIAHITKLGYSTYVVDGGTSGDAAPEIRLPVLYANGQKLESTTLVFDPANVENADVVVGAWQTWDTLAGDARWRITDLIPGVCDEPCLLSWEEVLAAIPDATILGAIFVELNTGTHEPDGAAGHVDALRINNVVYNFEPDAEIVAVRGYLESPMNSA